ncbi:cytochrome oxidase complex assembly protein 1-domain-containing protein, partial [Roridomyces roridus]
MASSTLRTALSRTSYRAFRQQHSSRPFIQCRRYTENTPASSQERASLYSNFQSRRDLPRIEKRWPAMLGLAVVVVTGWAAFLTYVTNETKVTSSVVKQILQWWLNGYPVIHGQINQLQGNIDLSFRIKGALGSGTVYFTSVRKAKGMPYEILRFRVILDDGRIVEVETSEPVTTTP